LNWIQNHKKIYTISIILSVLSLSLLPIIISENNDRPKTLDISFDQINNQMLHIYANVPSFTLKPIQINDQQFTSITLEHEGYTNVIGEAKLPMIRRMIEIPYNASPTIIINQINWEEKRLHDQQLPFTIIPVQTSIEKPEQTTPFNIDDNYYSQQSFVPTSIVNILEINKIRGRRFAIIEIAPIQYNPTTGDLKLIISFDISVYFDIINMQKTIDAINHYSSESYESLYETMFANYGYYESFANIDNNPLGYLIIVHDSFYDEIMPLAEWKMQNGYNVTVTNTSEIPGGITANNIKTYIQNAYNYWNIPPSFVLLVGDTPQIPAFTGSICNSETDTYYGTMDGDIFSDIYVGRFPASSETHVETMVDKTIYYEQGNFTNTDWIKKATFIASDANGLICEQTHEYVINTHMIPHGYICDRIYESTGGSTDDISSSLNEGSSICVYSGHGLSTRWVCIYFSQGNINALTNQGMYPFVCSHACLTGSYANPECFGETWLRAANKGAIAFWGASCNTYWDEDDVIERRMFDAWWNESLDRIGEMTDRALYDAYIQNPGLNIQRFIQGYNIMGDPSVTIWTDVPDNYDIRQEQQDRGFPIRHAADGDWAGAQDFIPTRYLLKGAEIYLRKFGAPEFNLTIELRENAIDGALMDTLIFSPSEVPSSWQWFSLNFTDQYNVEGEQYFIIIPPAPNGVSTSFGYEWGYAFGNQYDNGAFWFTRDSGNLWRDLPTMYEFTFRSY